jgi:hypothetical protein
MIFFKVNGLNIQADGHHSRTICDEEKIPYEWQEMEFPDKAAAIQWVKENQAHRRNLTPEEVKFLRLERIERVAEAHKNGQSTRQIAQSEGVSQPQVVADIKDAGDKGLSPDPVNGKVTGKDGKQQAARKKRTPKEPKPPTTAEANGSANGTPAEPPKPAEVPTDEVEQPIPEKLLEVFAKRQDFKAIVNQLNAINRSLKEISEHPGGACLRLQNAQIDLKNLKESVHFDMPYAVCGMCKGVGGKPGCACKGRGWLVQTSYKNLPQEMRA